MWIPADGGVEDELPGSRRDRPDFGRVDLDMDRK